MEKTIHQYVLHTIRFAFHSQVISKELGNERIYEVSKNNVLLGIVRLWAEAAKCRDYHKYICGFLQIQRSILMPGSKPPKHVCRFCSRHFGSRKSLNFHISYSHPFYRQLATSVITP
ncbi:hypothetical protein [Xenorhabdus szentirmaii]|uniref:hypothetical protein n=1 Tax=Xenorhabdus szentirmaii TaxID=290112 RepID=UPI00198801E0|nr:hypothetical protein [Xenorhabdus sp. 5]MBD2826097.1 hypothetical protein [Xenorhabdus sp. 5]